MDDLTSTVGVVALAAGAIGLLALVLLGILALRIRRLRDAQRTVLGESGERDLVAHAQSLQRSFDELHSYIKRTVEGLEGRLKSGEQRLDRAISRSAVIRYDAYGEMSGRQSSTMALLDDTGTGVVMSSILHREQARMYVKRVRDGESELELSPEEKEAIRDALVRDDSR